MVKKIITTSLVATALLLSGCGENSDGESALDTQQMLDNKDFDGVIRTIDANSTSESDNLALAAAYMGKAGFSPSSIIGIVASSADSNDSGFASFIQSTNDKSNSQSLKNMKTAVTYYKRVVPSCDDNASLTGAGSDVCLYIGLSQVSQTAVAVSYIADNVSVLSDNNNSGSDPKLTASTCAMQYAFDGNTTSNSDCNFSSESNVTFTESNVTYGDVKITVDNNQTFEYLLTPPKNSSAATEHRSTVLTDGYCTLSDFTTRVSDTNSSNYNASTYHVCPVDEDGESNTTTEDTLVTALNEGTDSIGAAVSDETKDDIDQFKKDVLEANGRANDSNTTITIEDINAYLEQQNN